MAYEQPAYGQLRVSNELRKKSILVSPDSVRSIWLSKTLITVKQKSAVHRLMESVRDFIRQYRMSFIRGTFRKKYTIILTNYKLIGIIGFTGTIRNRGTYCHGKKSTDTFGDLLPLVKAKNWITAYR